MADTLPETPAPVLDTCEAALGRGEDERDHTCHTLTLPLAG